MRYLPLVGTFMGVSAQQELAYGANFGIGLLNTLINVVTGWLGLAIVFGQVESIHGWSYASALAVLGVYLVVGAVRDLVISPSLDRLAGLEGDLWRGTLDFVLLRPINTQFLVSLREWRLLALFDMLLGFVVIGVALLAVMHYGPRFADVNFEGTRYFVWVWLVISVLNGFYGHVRAGIPALNEIGAFVPIFGIPAALAWYLMRRQ